MKESQSMVGKELKWFQIGYIITLEGIVHTKNGTSVIVYTKDDILKYVGN